MSNGTILIVDDDPGVVAGLEALLEDSGWTTRSAENARQAYVEFAACSPDVVLLDVGLPDAAGLEVLQQLKAYAESTAVIMMSGGGTIEKVVECMKAGAESFIQKPFDGSILEATLEQVLKVIAIRRRVAALSREASDSVEKLPGVSAAAGELNRVVDQVVHGVSPILIEGESGSGKGVLARFIHQRSPRANGPFVDLNCAGLSKELLESELFGHEKGAFTGAVFTKQGLFEVAASGTLFLDEIGELEGSIQARLLKAVEERKFRRVGGVRDFHADFRLIAATNRSLREEVAEGRFRKDLYYRLNVVTIRVPPLRDRLDDIPIFAPALVKKLAAEIGRKPPALSDRAMQKLSSYPWPGNIRELRNVLERAMLVAPGKELLTEHLYLDDAMPRRKEDTATALPTREWEIRPLDEVSSEYIKASVQASGGNLRKAARLLRISPSTLYARVKNRG